MKLPNYFILFLMFCTLLYCKRSPFNNDNFYKDEWVKHFLSYDTLKNFSDTTEISIRVSAKSVMSGFVDPDAPDSSGAFDKLITILDGFKNTPHNPKTKKQFLFFDGSRGGIILDSTSNNKELFNRSRYIASENNLHDQFRAISKEIISSYNQKKFYVILSDGETTIRRYRTSNTSELSDIRDAVKDILIFRPNMCIGIVSLLANFNGKYQYEIKPDNSKDIHCKRYLYAFCFFDISFMPEFQKFSEGAITANGTAFIFNPKIPQSFFSTTFDVYPKRIGSINKSKSNLFAAYSFYKNIPDSILISGRINNLNRLIIPNLSYKISFYKPSGKYVLKSESTEIKRGNCYYNMQRNTFFMSLQLSKNISPGIYAIETVPMYSPQIDKIVPPEILNQDIDDNTFNEVKSIGPNDILKTEGLKDLCETIFKAINDVQPPVFYKTCISILK